LQIGFTYVGLLLLIAMIGVTAAATVQLGAVAHRRQAELELLFLGRQFVDALASYSATTPTGGPRLPKELSDLLKDPRVPELKRHLRRVPIDPLTGHARWGLRRTPDGFIEAVHSLSDARPIKATGFEHLFRNFENATTYRDWVFASRPLTASSTEASAAQGR
jgi:type II secretory pathway pseudopilin PulG